MAIVASGCGDRVSEPIVPVATLLRAPDAVASAYALGLTARPGEAVAVAPAVLVIDAEGRALPGIEVQFAVTAGGGQVEFASVRTDQHGLASGGTWTLGLLPGVNELRARSGGLDFVFRAQALDPPFRITVRYSMPAPPEFVAAMTRAVKRWESIITGDLPDQALHIPAGTCFDKQPGIDERVDDLLIYVHIDAMDGKGGYFGEAGPCYLRSSSLLPLMGFVKIDADDLAWVSETDYLDDLLLHEVGHVLGIGTLWLAKGLLDGAGGEDPFVRGAFASAVYRDLGGADAFVPAENAGGTLTRDVHWRESVFLNELMTSYINEGGNPLSVLTVATLQDLGYVVNADAAHSYALRPGPAIGSRINLHEGERVAQPRFIVDRTNRVDVIQP